MSVQSLLLDLMKETFPSKHVSKEVLFDAVPELKELDGLMGNPTHLKFDMLTHSLKVMDNLITKNAALRLVGLLHDIGKPKVKVIRDGIVHFPDHEKVGAEMVSVIARRLGFDSVTVKYMTNLVVSHKMNLSNKDDDEVKMIIMTDGEDFLNDLLKLKIADLSSHGYCMPENIKLMKFQEDLKEINNNIAKSYKPSLQKAF